MSEAGADNSLFCRRMMQVPSGKKLIVIAGPTAVGKTAVSIRIARHFKTEIVSADSRQFFRELEIGTAKPTARELAEVKHHFVNSHSIAAQYDAAQYGDDAMKIIHELFQNYSSVILCGGSGLYIRAVTEGFDDIPEVSSLIREDLIREYEANGIAWLQEKMKAEDPGYFTQLDAQNPHRLIRALEVKLGTGKSIGSFRRNLKRDHAFEIVKVGLELPREELYQRIDYRMDEMVAAGLFDEAKALYPFRSHNALQTVGYREIFDYIDGLYSREETIELLKRNSRRYAKRQLTWFKKDPAMKWFHPDEIDNIVSYING
jgi:tRNA dimethylallyltransferase